MHCYSSFVNIFLHLPGGNGYRHAAIPSMLLDPLCTAREFSDVSGIISNHYRESQHGTRRS